jgi:ribonuclease HIII
MEEEKSRAPFVTNVTDDVVEKLKIDLKQQGFELSEPPYTIFQAKKKGVSCTLYTSLKLTVMGKGMEEFIAYYLEPEILKSTPFTYPQEDVLDETPRIGVDESGKGDFFGPLCIAAVFCGGKDVYDLKKLGVKDSKTMSDVAALKISTKIKERCPHSVVRISPLKYNELYTKFKNLNSLLAWGHATAIETVSKQTACQNIIIDQFAHEVVIQKAMKQKNLDLKPILRIRGEQDIVVAAASILARAAFLEGLSHLSREFQLTLPKGASAKVVDTGKMLVYKWGKNALERAAKLHFRTTQEVLAQNA